jgi:hypothetical protein
MYLNKLYLAFFMRDITLAALLGLGGCMSSIPVGLETDDGQVVVYCTRTAHSFNPYFLSYSLVHPGKNGNVEVGFYSENGAGETVSTFPGFVGNPWDKPFRVTTHAVQNAAFDCELQYDLIEYGYSVHSRQRIDPMGLQDSLGVQCPTY